MLCQTLQLQVNCNLIWLKDWSASLEDLDHVTWQLSEMQDLVLCILEHFRTADRSTSTMLCLTPQSTCVKSSGKLLRASKLNRYGCHALHVLVRISSKRQVLLTLSEWLSRS